MMHSTRRQVLVRAEKHDFNSASGGFDRFWATQLNGERQIGPTNHELRLRDELGSLSGMQGRGNINSSLEITYRFGS